MNMLEAKEILNHGDIKAIMAETGAARCTVSRVLNQKRTKPLKVKEAIIARAKARIEENKLIKIRLQKNLK